MIIKQDSFLYKWLTFLNYEDRYYARDSYSLVRTLIKVSLLTTLMSLGMFWIAYTVIFDLIMFPEILELGIHGFLQIVPIQIAVITVLIIGLAMVGVILVILFGVVYLLNNSEKIDKYIDNIADTTPFKLYDSWKNKYCIPITYEDN